MLNATDYYRKMDLLLTGLRCIHLYDARLYYILVWENVYKIIIWENPVNPDIRQYILKIIK